MTNLPLFRVRPWDKGVRCMSFYILTCVTFNYWILVVSTNNINVSSHRVSFFSQYVCWQCLELNDMCWVNVHHFYWNRLFNPIFILCRMKQQIVRIWMAMVALTIVTIIWLMQKRNIFRNVAYSMNSGDFYGKSPLHESRQKDPAIITLFTTLKESYNKSYIHKNVFRNWGLLSPEVMPVLFTDLAVSSNILDSAHQRKWHIFPVPKRSRSGLPILRYMFLEAQELYDTQFYGYVNSDLLFDRGFTDTLHSLIRLKKKLTNILIVGRRKNWHINWQQNVTELEEIGEYAKSANLFRDYAMDYFISTHNGFPWSFVPDFVVGRPAYDTWLMATAIKLRIPVVDATLTITALHQTDAKGVREGFSNNLETSINEQFIGNEFPYNLGRTTCAPFYTSKSNGSIIVQERISNGKECNGHYAPYVTSPFHISWTV